MKKPSDYRKPYMSIVDDHFPETLKVSFGDVALSYRKCLWSVNGSKKGLRYGENPRQEAAVYELVSGNLVLGECAFISNGNQLVSGIGDEDLLQAGKHPSMNNLTDVDSALNILRYFDAKPTSVIIKHNNPSGVASRDSIAEAYCEANLADCIAAFGGVAVFNRVVDRKCAELVSENYLEVVCAPGFGQEALGILKAKKDLRIIRIGNIGRLHDFASYRFVDFRSLIDGGLVVQQSPFMGIRGREDLKVASAVKDNVSYVVDREPSDDEVRDLLFSWKVQQGVTSNSVVFVKDEATVGIGTGEQDRVGVAKIAAFKAYEKYAARLSVERYKTPYWLLNDKSAKEDIDALVQERKGNLAGSVMASDGFFPFRDTVDVAAGYGVTAIIQPGGSIRDYDSIKACNEHGIAMVFTGQRAFRH